MVTPKQIVELYSARSLTCATAESCTGGGIGALITSVSGASEVFKGGIISYANEVKREVLGVSQEILDAFGAVSSECAKAMAVGARKVIGADVAVAVTGIAGPGGGTKEKPVGLVYFGVSSSKGEKTARKVFSGTREEIRIATQEYALALLAEAAI